MNRNNFIKATSFSTFGIATGLLSPSKLFARRNDLIMPITSEIEITIEDGPQFWEWLLDAVGSALVSALVGVVVDNFKGNNGYNNGSSCTNNNAASGDYTNAKGYYGYPTQTNRFLTQEITDGNVGFKNASVAFVDPYGNKITNVEGPFLAGLCYAAQNICQSNGVDIARSVVIPTGEINNGGYRFDLNPCYPTVFQTNYGKTQITYNPLTPNYVSPYTPYKSVDVQVMYSYNNLPNWRQTYKLNNV